MWPKIGEKIIIDKNMVAKKNLIKIWWQKKKIIDKIWHRNKWMSALSFTFKTYLSRFHSFLTTSVVQWLSSSSRVPVDLGSGQIKDYKIGICCFFSKHSTLRSKNKDWLALNQINVSELSDMSLHRLLFQRVTQ